jgi:iron complex outermembrane receptor protein
MDAIYTFNIPRQTLASALITLALEGDISISRPPGLTCRGQNLGLIGRYTIAKALETLLKNSGCTFVMADARTVKIVAAVKVPPSRSAPKGREPDPASPTEVVVTASRRSEAIDRSPFDVTRVGGDELLDGQVTDIGDLASMVAGMTVTNLGPGRDKILLRGLSDGIFTGRTQSTVGLYLDDVPLTYNAPNPDLRMIDIEAVEVLRGPQGALYGAGSIGGVVHILTRQPDLEAYSGSLDATASITEGGGPSTAVDGVVNLPLVQDRLGLRIVAYRELDGGYIDDEALKLSNVNETTRTGARVLALLQLGGNWKATLGGIYQALNSADSQYGTEGIGTFSRANLVREPQDNDFNELSLVIEGGQNGWRFKSSTARVHHQITSQYDASDSLALFAPGLTGAAPFTELDHKSILSQEFTLASDTTNAVQWLVGVFASDDEENSASRLTDLSGPVPPTEVLYSEDRSDTIDEYAAYGEFTFSPLPKVFLTIGGRLFRSEASTRSTVANPTLMRSVNAQINDQGVAPKAVARYQFTSRAMIYAQATEGYRGGGLNTSGVLGQTFGTVASGVQPFQKFSGDELWNYEIGAKLTTFGSKLSVRAAAFYDSWQNIQSDQILPSGLPFTANVGDGLNEGLEIEALFQPSPRLFVRGNAVFNDPELIARAPSFASVAEARLPGIARSSLGIEGDYHRPLNGGVVAFANLRASYVGRSTTSFDAATIATMGDYFTETLSAGLGFGSWRLGFFVDNPGNTVGNTFAYGNPFSIRTVKQITPLTPRTVGMSLRAAF